MGAISANYGALGDTTSTVNTLLAAFDDNNEELKAINNTIADSSNGQTQLAFQEQNVMADQSHAQAIEAGTATVSAVNHHLENTMESDAIGAGGMGGFG